MKHPVLFFWVVWNLLFCGVNLWTGDTGWAAFSGFCAVVVAWVWTAASARDRERQGP